MKTQHECKQCAERTGYPHYFRSERQLKEHWRDMHKKTKKRSRKPIPAEIKRLVIARDGHKCVGCSSTSNLHVHHKIHREHGGTDETDNLLTLCDLCHTEQHRGEQVYNLMIKRLFRPVTVI